MHYGCGIALRSTILHCCCQISQTLSKFNLPSPVLFGIMLSAPKTLYSVFHASLRHSRTSRRDGLVTTGPIQPGSGPPSCDRRSLLSKNASALFSSVYHHDFDSSNTFRAEGVSVAETLGQDLGTMLSSFLTTAENLLSCSGAPFVHCSTSLRICIGVRTNLGNSSAPSSGPECHTVSKLLTVLTPSKRHHSTLPNVYTAADSFCLAERQFHASLQPCSRYRYLLASDKGPTSQFKLRSTETQ